jgi:hypothetical protein
VQGPVTLALVLLFFLLGPGTALIGWLRPDEAGAGLGLIVGTSLATATVAAQTMLTLGVWSPTPALCVAAGACLLPLARQLHFGLAQRRAGSTARVVEPLRISIIVPGGASGVALRTALCSILDADADDVQVIVVDRHPETVKAVEAVAALSDARLLYTRSPQESLSAARDAGIRVATGDIVLFATPDSVVHEGWLEALVAPFSDARVGCVVGRLPERGAGLHTEDLELLGSVDMVDALWDGTHAVSFATRRDLTGAPLATYAPGALAWPQLRLVDDAEAASA